MAWHANVQESTGDDHGFVCLFVCCTYISKRRSQGQQQVAVLSVQMA